MRTINLLFTLILMMLINSNNLMAEGMDLSCHKALNTMLANSTEFSSATMLVTDKELTKYLDNFERWPLLYFARDIVKLDTKYVELIELKKPLAINKIKELIKKELKSSTHSFEEISSDIRYIIREGLDEGMDEDINWLDGDMIYSGFINKKMSRYFDIAIKEIKKEGSDLGYFSNSKPILAENIFTDHYPKLLYTNGPVFGDHSIISNIEKTYSVILKKDNKKIVKRIKKILRKKVSYEALEFFPEDTRNQFEKIVSVLNDALEKVSNTSTEELGFYHEQYVRKMATGFYDKAMKSIFKSMKKDKENVIHYSFFIPSDKIYRSRLSNLKYHFADVKNSHVDQFISYNLNSRRVEVIGTKAEVLKIVNEFLDADTIWDRNFYESLQKTIKAHNFKLQNL